MVNFKIRLLYPLRKSPRFPSNRSLGLGDVQPLFRMFYRETVPAGQVTPHAVTTSDNRTIQFFIFKLLSSVYFPFCLQMRNTQSIVMVKQSLPWFYRICEIFSTPDLRNALSLPTWSIWDVRSQHLYTIHADDRLLSGLNSFQIGIFGGGGHY
jgi:hypothetical protein